MNIRSTMLFTLATASLLGVTQSASADSGARLSGDAKAEPGGLVANVHVNALGFLIFGLTAGGEIGASHWGIGAQVRWISSGLYAREKLPRSDDESISFSYGAGLGARYYSAAQGPLTGLFVGPALEYAHTRFENQSTKIATLTGLVVPELEVGYRWRLGSWLFDLGAAGGYAIVAGRSVEDINGGHNSLIYSNEAANTVYGSVLGDVGVFF